VISEKSAEAVPACAGDGPRLVEAALPNHIRRQSQEARREVVLGAIVERINRRFGPHCVRIAAALLAGDDR